MGNKKHVRFRSQHRRCAGRRSASQKPAQRHGHSGRQTSRGVPGRRLSRTTAVGRQCHQAPGAAKAAPTLLEQLEANCTRNGIQVHWAEDTAEANGIVLDIMRRHDAPDIVKGKSMVSEEMHLNHFSRRKRHRSHGDRSGRVHHSAQPRNTLAHHRAGHSQEQRRSGHHFSRQDCGHPLHRKRGRADGHCQAWCCASASPAPRWGFPGSISPSPRPAPCCWWKTKATAACAPPFPMCTWP
jgi:hypothetical protein